MMDSSMAAEKVAMKAVALVVAKEEKMVEKRVSWMAALMVEKKASYWAA